MRMLLASRNPASAPQAHCVVRSVAGVAQPSSSAAGTLHGAECHCASRNPAIAPQAHCVLPSVAGVPSPSERRPQPSPTRRGPVAARAGRLRPAARQHGPSDRPLGISPKSRLARAGYRLAGACRYCGGAAARVGRERAHDPRLLPTALPLTRERARTLGKCQRGSHPSGFATVEPRHVFADT